VSDDQRHLGPGTTPAHLLAEIGAMVRFYSRLSPPPLSRLDDPAVPPPFAIALRMLPLAGVVIAAPGALVLGLLAMTQLSSLAVAIAALTVTTIVTGAFHEDGIADIADGFGGGATPERRLEIMKDSRIGAFGGVALVAQFALRAALLGDLLEGFDGPSAAVLVLGIAAVARVAPLALMALLPPARADGLARAVGQPAPAALATAFGLALALHLVAALPICGPSAALAGLVACSAALFGLGRLTRAKIGGVTGDVVGAGTIVAEIALMLGLAAA
jgi:adenosylcobinamide-GDP ribazoletransferase